MKQLIRKVLNEALGVPEGLLEVGEELYNIIENKLKRLPSELPEEKNFHINQNFKILDFFIKKVILTIEYTETDQVEEVDFYSMAFKNASRFNNEKFHLINVIDNDTIEVIINFAGPEGSTKKDLLNYYTKDRRRLISSISHELGHAFNFYKKKISPIKSTATYAGLSRLSFPIKAIQKFLHYLYYIHSIENIVRPIEVASMMKTGEIDREGFYDFITNDRVYKMMKEINSYSYQQLRNELEEDVSRIAHFLKQIGVKRTFKTSDEVIDELLRIVYINLMNHTIGTAKEMMFQNPLEEILGFIGDKEKFFNRLVNSFTKYEEYPEKFFQKEEKNMKMVSEKMMKKLIKLYDMAKINPKSIENWELHHKINRTGEQFETELKFKRKLK